MRMLLYIFNDFGGHQCTLLRKTNVLQNWQFLQECTPDKYIYNLSVLLQCTKESFNNERSKNTITDEVKHRNINLTVYIAFTVYTAHTAYTVLTAKRLLCLFI